MSLRGILKLRVKWVGLVKYIQETLSRVCGLAHMYAAYMTHFFVKTTGSRLSLDLLPGSFRRRRGVSRRRRRLRMCGHCPSDARVSKLYFFHICVA